MPPKKFPTIQRSCYAWNVEYPGGPPLNLPWLPTVTEREEEENRRYYRRLALVVNTMFKRSQHILPSGHRSTMYKCVFCRGSWEGFEQFPSERLPHLADHARERHYKQYMLRMDTRITTVSPQTIESMGDLTVIFRTCIVNFIY